MLPKEQYLEMQSKVYDSLVNFPSPANELSRLKNLLDNHYVVIDFSAKRPEAAWQVWLDRLYLAALPVWFDWLKWIMMLAALKVIAVKSGSPTVGWLVIFSSLLMLLYFIAFFGRIRIRGLSFIGSERKQFLVSVILSGLFSLGAYWCAMSLADAVARMS